MKFLLASIIAVIAFSVAGVAQAGHANLCAQGGWQTAQSGSGSSFASMQECVKAREVYRPTLSADPTSVVAMQVTIITGTGFHPDMPGTYSIAVTGQSPYTSFSGLTNSDGTAILILSFSGCGTDPPYDLTITFTDEAGVHASTRITLC